MKVLDLLGSRLGFYEFLGIHVRILGPGVPNKTKLTINSIHPIYSVSYVPSSPCPPLTGEGARGGGREGREGRRERERLYLQDVDLLLNFDHLRELLGEFSPLFLRVGIETKSSNGSSSSSSK